MPLNEGMVMDMPISVPRTSISQAADDVKARNMVLCRFPEIQMVVGKAGRAETPFDPAPLDMIESMVEFRPRAWWPRRRLPREAAERHAHSVWNALVDAQLIRATGDSGEQPLMLHEAVDAGLLRYDAIQREVSHLRVQEFLHTLGDRLANSMARATASRLQASGQLLRPFDESDITALRNRIPLGHLRQLAVEPTDEQVEIIVRDMWEFLKSHQLLRPVESAAAESAPLASNDLLGISPRQRRAIQGAGRRTYQACRN
jgi:hypothetical protein